MSNFVAGGYEAYAFQHAAASGAMAAGLSAASEIYQFRWAPGAGAKKARILGVFLSAADGATAFAAGSALFSMQVARAWTAAGTGGSAVTPSGNSNKLRTSQVASLFSAGGEIRVATTAALTAGTKSLDAQPIGNIVGGAQATAGIQLIYQIPLYADWESSYGVPLVLDHQEGFSIIGTVPATGVWQFGVTTFWAEID